MKINRIDIYHFSRPFSIRFHSPQAFRIQADSLLLAIVLENGITGWGECVPRPYVTGETRESVTDTLGRIAAPLLFDARIEHVEEVDGLIDQLDKECHTRHMAPCQCVLAAVDLALIDAVGQLKCQSLDMLLSRPERVKTVLTSLSIPFLNETVIRDLFPMLREKLDLKAAKVILGDDIRENSRRVAMVRKLGGRELDLRIEANGKWTLETALKQMNALEGFGLTGVEQPLRPDDIEGLKAFRKQVGLPVILDESVCSVDDVRRLLDADACDVFNIKVSKCGGLQSSIKMVEMVEAGGKRCQVGTHVGETEILGNAAAFLSKSVVTGDLWADIGSRILLIQADTPMKGTPPGRDRVAPWGLGLDQDYLETLKAGGERVAVYDRPSRRPGAAAARIGQSG